MARLITSKQGICTAQGFRSPPLLPKQSRKSRRNLFLNPSYTPPILRWGTISASSTSHKTSSSADVLDTRPSLQVAEPTTGGWRLQLPSAFLDSVSGVNN
eukprot:GHVH01014758.1.p2 GENE.GHVH01014758.1~~GHVH01014758.1.p2  ORF type:complete len:100 (+),score=8.66 GHVH01014758.1:117-416(+)